VAVAATARPGVLLRAVVTLLAVAATAAARAAAKVATADKSRAAAVASSGRRPRYFSRLTISRRCSERYLAISLGWYVAGVNGALQNLRHGCGQPYGSLEFAWSLW
jgi:hypothetical protein